MIPLDELKKILGRGVSIIGCDKNGLVALEKSCGVLSHPNENGGGRMALLACEYDFAEQCYLHPGGGKIYLLNRLDSPVSGVILLGLNPEVAQAAKAAFENKTVEKKYVALVKGFPRHSSGIWRCRLRKNFVGRSIKISTGAGVYAETSYEVVESFRVHGVTLSVLNLFPLSGRTHQLRVHCSQNGLPIVGDETYGSARFNAFFLKNFGGLRLFLHAEKISLFYEIGGRHSSFAAESSVNFFQFLEEIKNAC
ncbi:MAG: RNA pseudouridine synthase [Puniceicoccales bacterium]|nr:RNA pseudouridine synthase [Puniceicoccales bacterium]